MQPAAEPTMPKARRDQRKHMPSPCRTVSHCRACCHMLASPTRFKEHRAHHLPAWLSTRFRSINLHRMTIVEQKTTNPNTATKQHCRKFDPFATFTATTENNVPLFLSFWMQENQRQWHAIQSQHQLPCCCKKLHHLLLIRFCEAPSH